MYLGNITRGETSPLNVFVANEDLSAITEASPALSDDVNEFVATTRNEFLGKFAADSVPGVSGAHTQAIEQYYGDLGVNVSPVTLVDPAHDADEIRRILSGGFMHAFDVDFACGTPETPASPGANSVLDLVVLYDWRQRYADSVRSTVADWEHTISDEAVEQAANFGMVDLVVHELGHTVTGFMLGNVILEKDDDSPTGYVISSAMYDAYQPYSAGFDLSPSVPLFEDDYYAGDSIDEGMAAHLSAGLLFKLQNGETDPASIEEQYDIYALTTYPDGQTGENGVKGLHSGEAGIAIHKLGLILPEFRTLMLDKAAGKLTDEAFYVNLKQLLPLGLLNLGLQQNYSSWLAFSGEVDKLAEKSS